MAEVQEWITINGQHVPILNGESKDDAYNRFVAKHNSDTKEAQIKKNQEQADKLNREKQIAELEQQYAETKGFFAKAKIQRKIEMLKSGWKGTEEEYIAYKNKQWEEEKAKREKEYQEKQAAEKKAKAEAEEKKRQELEHELQTQPKEKVEQYQIIQKYNPMRDDYHVGIRKPSDIKTWKEVVDSKDDDSFAWGDFSRKDAEKALASGKITIYSSYPINQGVFVSTSKVQSEQYAGGKGKKVYSRTVPLSEVAWINGDEGQFAKRK